MNDKHSSQHDDLQKEHELESHEVKQVLVFLKHYGKIIGIGMLAAIIVMLSSRGCSQQSASKRARGEGLLVAARSAQQFEEIIDRFGSTPAAPVALLGLAKTFFNNGDYFQARAEYERFFKKYKKSELRPLAEFGMASCSNADGDFGGAIEQFKAFVDIYSGHYLQSPATLALADSLKQANRLDEARIVLEDFLAGAANSQWSAQAENALQQLD